MGLVFAPIDNLVLTVDYWQISQRDIVGILSSQTQILYDALLRSQGSYNENVVRDESGEILYVANDYINLLPRDIAGVDYSASYSFDTNIGEFAIDFNASNLRKFDQGIDWMTDIVTTAQENGNEALLYEGENVELYGSEGSLLRQGGHPKWRGNIGLKWHRDEWGAGIKYKYISSVIDTGLYYTDDNGDTVYYVIDSWSTIDAYVNYQFTDKDESLLNNTKFTFGMRNLEDKDPPFSSGTFGYESSLHSSGGRYIYFNATKRF